MLARTVLFRTICLAEMLFSYCKALPSSNAENKTVDFIYIRRMFEVKLPNQTCKSAALCRRGGSWDPHANSCRCREWRDGPCCQFPKCMGGALYSPELSKCVCQYPAYQYGELCEHAHCRNGGRSENGQCSDCDAMWKGLFCDVIQCFNLGQHTVENDVQVCKCTDPERYYGRHCEYLMCDNGGTHSLGMEACTCPFPYKGVFCEHLNRMLLGTISVVLVSLSSVGLFFGYRYRQIKKAESRKETRRLRRAQKSIKCNTNNSNSNTDSGSVAMSKDSIDKDRHRMKTKRVKNTVDV